MDVACERNHVHWFRKDLRLHDNPALLKSLENCDKFFGIYILDTEALSHCKTKTGVNVWKFFLQALKCLDDQLKAHNSRLHVLKGSVLRVLPTLFEQWKVSLLTFTADSEPRSRERDETVMSLAKAAGVEVVVETSHTLFEVDRYIDCNKGNVPITFDEFRQVFSSLGQPPSPVETAGSRHFKSFVSSTSEFVDTHFEVPSLSDLNIFDSGEVSSALVGGEKEGLRCYCNYKEQLSGNVQTVVSPFHKSSKLSPYLRYGCISVRMVYHEMNKLLSKFKNSSAVTRGLLMRDFFFMLASRISNWDKVEGNPLCLSLPWESHDDHLTKFREGRTGFPWIDAIVRQLRQEGWIHDEARQALAYFLTRGCLWISWEEGFKFFEEYSIDADWSTNAGNWLWVSCSSFLNQQAGSFCPVSEGKRLDVSGEFVRKYLPALRGLPDQYIYEPWKAPTHVQKQAKCIIGEDYPTRMIDHVKAIEVCVERLNEYHKELIRSMPLRVASVVHWFKKDLRVHDNPALLEAVRNEGKFYGVYVFDPLAFSSTETSGNRARFLFQCLKDLDAKLRECGSFLYVIRGSPLFAFRQIFSKWGITKLTMEEDTEPYGKKLDECVTNLAKKCDIQVITKVSHTLYSIPQIIESNNGQAPFTFKIFISTIKKIGQPPNPVPPLDSTIFHGNVSPILPNCHLPTLEEFGLNHATYNEGTGTWIGGETEALKRFQLLQTQIEDGTVATSSSTLQDITFPKVTSLSPYLRYGCISPRLLYHTLLKLQKKVTNPQFIVAFLMKLMFRDFLFTLGYQNFFFDKVSNNPVCLKIPWESNGDFMTRWRQAKTGFPWIDAVMTQLRQEGWANHLGRQATACFLTRGCLWVSWEEGFKACQELQLDFEWSLCAANWLMISCSSFFVRSDKYYCPVNTGKRVDPQGMFIRKYIPQLRNFPAEYIYDPWNAPLEVQKAAGCIIGEDYPMRVIDHEKAKLVCANRLKELMGELREGLSSSVSLSEENEPQVKRRKTSFSDNTPTLSVFL